MTLPVFKNRVGMSVASVASGGTGTYTLDAALADHQAFAAGDDGLLFDAVAVEAGVGWEVARECTYTHSGTTLSRGTLEASSTGSAVAFSAAVEVFVTHTAERVRLTMQYGLPKQQSDAPTTGNVAGKVGMLHLVDISGITAARSFELPSAFKAGDRCGVLVTATHATLGRELILTAASGDTLNGVAGGTEWSRIWQVGEIVVFRATADNATWIVETDGRIAAGFSVISHASNTQSFAALSFTQFNSTCLSTVLSNIGGCYSSSSVRLTARRSGVWSFAGHGQWGSVATNTSFILIFRKDGSDFAHSNRSYVAAATNGNLGVGGAVILSLAPGEYMEPFAYNAHASAAYSTVAGVERNGFSGHEVL